MSGMTRKRISFSFKHDPYADSPDAAVLTYLKNNPVRELKTTVLETLRMCWLAMAYQEQGSLSDFELRQVALNCCDALEKHINYIRTSFRLESPSTNFSQAQVMATPVYVAPPNGNSGSLTPPPDSSKSQDEESDTQWTREATELFNL
jgi:hypothetical protein